MSKQNKGEMLTGLTPDLKKEIVHSLVASLLSDLNEQEKKDFLQSALEGRKKGRELIDMVAHWINECADSGVSPIEMSKEVLSAISHSYDIATYSTPELRSLFNDWLSEIEIEILEFLKDKGRVDPDEVVQHLRLERESIVFILSKLAREGKINMQESGT